MKSFYVQNESMRNQTSFLFCLILKKLYLLLLPAWETSSFAAFVTIKIFSLLFLDFISSLLSSNSSIHYNSLSVCAWSTALVLSLLSPSWCLLRLYIWQHKRTCYVNFFFFCGWFGLFYCEQVKKTGSRVRR